MFSKSAEYALRAVCVIARHERASLTSEEVAEETHVPLEYLRKVLQSLRRSGIVETQRGSGGGVSLSRPTDQITAWDVVNAVDPIQRIPTCPLGLAEHEVQLCPMHAQLDHAMELAEHALESMTIADLLDPKSRKRRQCHFPIAGI
ncbi:MAG: Rrf2 family transcriptional regulator [Planctomycetaceae bacterium]|nr:Rrf2 family transcriptional regulator [Planctomycetaceae bacterium]